MVRPTERPSFLTEPEVGFSDRTFFGWRGTALTFGRLFPSET